MDNGSVDYKGLSGAMINLLSGLKLRGCRRGSGKEKGRNELRPKRSLHFFSLLSRYSTGSTILCKFEEGFSFPGAVVALGGCGPRQTLFLESACGLVAEPLPGLSKRVPASRHRSSR